MNYILISLALILAGLISTKNVNLTRFSLVLIFIIPIGSYVDIQLSTLSFAKFLFIFLSLFHILRSFLCTEKVDLTQLLIGLLFLITYLLSTILSDSITIGQLLRDISPLLYFLLLPFFRTFFDKALINEHFIRKIVYLAIVSDVLITITAYTLKIPPSGIRGEFYLRTGIIRYSDWVSLTCFAFSSYFFFKETNKVSWLLSMTVIAFLSLDRILIIWSLICYFVFCITNRRYFIYFLCMAVISQYFLFLNNNLIFDDISEISNRFYEVVDTELLLSALHMRFIEPALEGGWFFSVKSLLVGMGAGFEFYIPWFDYRNLSPYQVSVDSYYIAFFIKYGLLGLLFFSALIFSYLRPLSISGLWVMAYLLVHNGPIVDAFILLALFSCFIKLNSNYYLEKTTT